MMKIPQEWIDNKSLKPYTWPGGYPFFYMDIEDSLMCPDCATAALLDPNTPARWKPIAAEINYEDPDLFCDDCSQQIKPAYE